VLLAGVHGTALPGGPRPTPAGGNDRHKERRPAVSGGTHIFYGVGALGVLDSMRAISKKRQRQRRSPEGIAYRDMIAAKPWCWACGRSQSDRPRWWYADWSLQRMHVAAGGGRMVRVEDRRAAIVGCPLCHWRHRHHTYGSKIKLNSRWITTLTNANVLWVKCERDPNFWDWDWIVWMRASSSSGASWKSWDITRTPVWSVRSRLAVHRSSGSKYPSATGDYVLYTTMARASHGVHTTHGRHA